MRNRKKDEVFAVGEKVQFPGRGEVFEVVEVDYTRKQAQKGDEVDADLAQHAMLLSNGQWVWASQVIGDEPKAMGKPK